MIDNILLTILDSMPSMVASPIALDKDKRIRALEAELEELRHFQQTESQVQTSVMQA